MVVPVEGGTNDACGAFIVQKKVRMSIEQLNCRNIVSYFSLACPHRTSITLRLSQKLLDTFAHTRLSVADGTA
jgi:hypothetical protein